MAEGVRQRIVIVDDDPATLMLLQRQLQIAGFDVIACRDGRSALPAIQELSNGIVIADWDMPGMDGLQLCAAARELAQMQAVQNIYFILLTAHSSKERVVEGLDAGANDYLTKPYHQGELLARIKVGNRMLHLQQELLQRNMEVQKANAQMAILAQKLDEQASTDALTGLANRRCLFERLAEFWDSTARVVAPCSCIMLDADKFKAVNDNYGHQAGDEVLRYIAATIRRTVRRAELVGRFGGEEFLVLCPAMPLQAAAELSERVRGNIAAEPVHFENRTIPITVSCGVAQRAAHCDTPEAMIKQADAMLYAAKEHGRNQTWAYDAAGVGRRIEASTQPASSD